VSDPTEDGCSPGPDGEESAKEDDRIDALTTFARPVGCCVEVQPEGELVECKGGSDSVGECEKPAEQDGHGSVASANVCDFGIAGDEEQKDSPDEMMDVTAAHFDITEGADVMRDGGDQQTDSEKGDEEADGGEEEASLGAVGNLLADDLTGFGEVEDQQDERGDDRCEDQKDPGSGDVHR